MFIRVFSYIMYACIHTLYMPMNILARIQSAMEWVYGVGIYLEEQTFITRRYDTYMRIAFITQFCNFSNFNAEL